jgi:hypothetical protein
MTIAILVTFDLFLIGMPPRAGSETADKNSPSLFSIRIIPDFCEKFVIWFRFGFAARLTAYRITSFSSAAQLPITPYTTDSLPIALKCLWAQCILASSTRRNCILDIEPFVSATK